MNEYEKQIFAEMEERKLLAEQDQLGTSFLTGTFPVEHFPLPEPTSEEWVVSRLSKENGGGVCAFSVLKSTDFWGNTAPPEGDWWGTSCLLQNEVVEVGSPIWVALNR